jgi:hypothetical protein
MSDHFFSRWSRRKQGLETQEPSKVQPAPSVAPPVHGATDHAGALAVSADQPSTSLETTPAQDLPTMEDVEHLTPSSEFQGFMRQGVPGEVRNAAMKKLFTDPHFNVMDGLDIYIGDYNTPDPLPAGMLEKMVSAPWMGLLTPQDPPAAGGAPLVAQSPSSDIEFSPTTQPEPDLQVIPPTEHDHPDLQLQPNDAPPSPSAGPSTG